MANKNSRCSVRDQKGGNDSLDAIFVPELEKLPDSLPKRRLWTPREVAILTKYAQKGCAALGVALGRSSQAVRFKATQLGISIGG